MNDQTAAAAAPETATAKKPREAEVVEMSDGRKVEFVGVKTKVLKSVLVDGKPMDDLSHEELQHAHIGSLAIRMDFRNGTSRVYPLNPTIGLRYAAHGALQKYGDELAGEDAPDLDDWAASTDKLHERLAAGEWAKTRQGGGMAGTSVLIQALMEFTGRTSEEVKAHIANWTPIEKQALRNDADIKPIVDRIEKEKAAKSAHVDTSALKTKLMGLGAPAAPAEEATA